MRLINLKADRTLDSFKCGQFQEYVKFPAELESLVRGRGLFTVNEIGHILGVDLSESDN